MIVLRHGVATSTIFWVSSAVLHNPGDKSTTVDSRISYPTDKLALGPSIGYSSLVGRFHFQRRFVVALTPSVVESGLQKVTGNCNAVIGKIRYGVD